VWLCETLLPALKRLIGDQDAGGPSARAYEARRATLALLGGAQIRFYAGQPLKTHDGHPLGLAGRRFLKKIRISRMTSPI
jgi:hypothetical protein